MKIKRYLLSTFCLCMFTACDSDDNLLCYGTHTEIEGDVTTFGAVGDGKTDCSKAINSAIASWPAEGGVVIIPEGDFVLDAPIVINKHNVTIQRDWNPGMRSNIDVNGINELLGPGGGSKLVARNAEAAIKVETGMKGVKIMNLMVSGGTEAKNIGIHFAGTSDDGMLSNIIGINLHTGVKIEQAKNNMQIINCWVCELPNSIELIGGENIVVKNCQLGAQPTGDYLQGAGSEQTFVHQ